MTKSVKETAECGILLS